MSPSPSSRCSVSSRSLLGMGCGTYLALRLRTLLLDVRDDGKRFLAELLVVDLLRVDERAAGHRQRTHHAGLCHFVVGRTEQPRRLGVEQRAVAAARGARD